MPTRVSGLTVSVFTLGVANLLADIDDMTLTVENDEEDGAGINEAWDIPETLAYGWQLEGSIFVSSYPQFIEKAAATDISAAIVLTTGVKSYAGTVLVKTSAGKFGYGLQKESVTLVGQGALVPT